MKFSVACYVTDTEPYLVLWLLPSKALITQRKGGRAKCLLALRKPIIRQTSVSQMKKKLSVEYIQ